MLSVLASGVLEVRQGHLSSALAYGRMLASIYWHVIRVFRYWAQDDDGVVFTSRPGAGDSIGCRIPVVARCTVALVA